MTESEWHGDEWAFFLSEEVMIGTTKGIIVGQATFVSRQDEFLISFVDDCGLPGERWFKQYEVAKTRKN